MRLCAFWDCMEEVDEGMSFCQEHVRKLHSELIDRCPKCGRYKDIRQKYCPDCNYGRPIAGWKIASRNLDDVNEDQPLEPPKKNVEVVDAAPAHAQEIDRSAAAASRGEATCPSCGSPNLTYKKAFDYFKCNDCETTFITPVYSYGETNRWTGEPEEAGRQPDTVTPFQIMPEPEPEPPRQSPPPPPPVQRQVQPPPPPRQQPPPAQPPVWREPEPDTYYQPPAYHEPDYQPPVRREPDYQPPVRREPDYQPPARREQDYWQQPRYEPQPPSQPRQPMPPARREQPREQYWIDQSSVHWTEPVERADNFERYDTYDDYIPPQPKQTNKAPIFDFLKKQSFGGNKGFNEKSVRGNVSKTGWLYLLVVIAVVVLLAALCWMLFDTQIADLLDSLF